MTEQTSGTRIRLTVYDLPAGETNAARGSGVSCFAYVRSGTARLEANAGPEVIEADDGRFFTGRIIVPTGADVWLFEQAPAEAGFLDAEIVLSQPLTLGFARPFVVRADRIESTHGAQTPKHGHRGPGMRRLIFGRIRADVGDKVERIEAGHAWLETGTEPVVGTNYGGSNAAFVRLLVLPRELEGGKTSFMPSSPEEAKKPRSVAGRIFGEVICPP